MQNIESFLENSSISQSLLEVLMGITECLPLIADGLRKDIEGKSGKRNVTGDEQVVMDVYANDVLVEAMKRNSHVSLIASEELEVPLLSDSKGDSYTVVFDPLDGSSLADVNLAVGTIIGIYSGGDLLGTTGRDQVAAMIVVYGPRLTFMVTVGDGVHEFLYQPEAGEFVLHQENIQMQAEGSVMAPGNISLGKTEKWYYEFLEDMANNGYKLRYSGGMVPDVNLILKKGGGIYMYPGSREKLGGKLRLLYECAPMAFLVEQAGGMASNGVDDILDIEVTEYHQRSSIFIGSSQEVNAVKLRIEALH